MKVVAAIPARMGSSRFPGKPLAPMLGRPMIEHVYRRTAMASGVDEVYIATCDEEIRLAAEAFGAKVVMTSDQHQRASDRIAEAAENAFPDADVIVMVQGDEPLIVPQMVEASAKPIVEDLRISCTNLVARIGSEEEFLDRNTIKVLKDDADQAIYFSRAPIPSTALVAFDQVPAYKQVCVISFSLAGLRQFSGLEPTPLEEVESIDMLRYLEHRIPVRLVPTDRNTHAVDTPEDLRIVEAMLRDDPLTKEYL